jgi:hypothetical protein
MVIFGSKFILNDCRKIVKNGQETLQCSISLGIVAERN